MYEYWVVPAPDRAQRNRAVKSETDRFALTLAQVMNDQGAEGWEFLRSETLPVSERRGLWRRQMVMRTMLVFRRAQAVVAQPAAAPVPAPALARRRAEAPLVLADAAPERAEVRAEPRPESRPEPRPEPLFRPGAAMRAEGPRKYPPLRRVAPDGEGAEPDER